MGRHSSTSERRRRVRYAVGAGVLVVLVAAGLLGRSVLAGSDADAVACEQPADVQVAVPEAIYPTVFKAARRAENGGACADYHVSEQASGQVASDIIAGGTKVPDVWISDSPMWIDEVSGSLGKGWLTQGDTLATSPVVIAVPASVTDTHLPEHPTWLDLLGHQVPLTVSDPDQSTETVVAMAAAQSTVSTKAEDTDFLQAVLNLSRNTLSPSYLRWQSEHQGGAPRIFPASEQTIVDFNRAHKDASLSVVRPAPKAATLKYTWVQPLTGSAPPRAALTALEHQLTSDKGRAALRTAGFRVPGEQPPKGSPLPADLPIMATPSGKDAVTSIATWRNLAKDARMMVLVDVSGSMSFQMAPGSSRIDLLRGLALGALKSMPRSTEIGAWAFSTNLRGHGKDWKPLSDGIHEVGPPTKDNAFRQGLIKAVHRLPAMVARNGDTALYDSVWAAYQKVSSTYDPEYVNSVVVLTDGKNDDPNGGLNLSQLLHRLSKAYDPDKPVKIVTISIGNGTDPSALRKIATTTGGLSYHPKTAEQIVQVFIDAFLHRT